MAQQIDIVANLLMKVDGAEAGLNKLKNSLGQLKIPAKFDADLKKSFSNLEGLFAKYKSQLEGGFKTKGDVSGFAKTGKQIEAEYDRIAATISKLTGKEVSLKVDLTGIQNAQKEIEKLIAQKEKLSQDIKGGLGLNDYLEAMRSSGVGRRGTKVFDASNVLQTSLEKGDIEKAKSDVQSLIAELNRMSEARKQALEAKTGVSFEQIVETLKSKVDAADQSMTKLGSDIKTTSDNMAQMQTSQMDKAGQALSQIATEAGAAQSGIKGLNGEAQGAAQNIYSMATQLEQLKTSTQYFFGLRNMLNLFKRGIKEAVTTVKELDAAMTETAVVTEYSVGDMWAKLPEYTANANALGATVKDMYESTTLYYQQGLNTQQAMGIATETMKMARIGGLEAADATDKMTAALRGFNMEINEASAQRVNDVYSNLAAKTASDTEELGTAMQRTASIAASAGMSFEGTAAFLAQAIETTREPAENLGTAMKTIVARFTELKKNPLEITEVDGEEVSYNKVDTALQSIGVSLKDANGQFRDLDKVFLDISQRWDSLTQTQQRYIATTAAGSRQQSRFIAMMSNYDRTMQLMDYANNSAGASQEQFGKTLESLEAKLNKFQNAWKQFLMGIMNDKWTKKIVDAGTGILNVVNKVIDALSFHGKAGLLKSVLSTFTAFTALKFAGRGANMLIGGLGGMLDPRSTFKAGAQTGAIGKNSAQAINQPIVRELQSIRALLAQRITQSNLGRNITTGPYDELNRFRSARAEISQLSSKGNVNSLIKQLSGLSAGSQNTLMRGYASTFQAATSAIIGSYGRKNIPDVTRGANFLNNQRKSAQITAEEYYMALRDPGLLKQAMLKAGVQQKNPAYEYMDSLDKTVTEQAKILATRAKGQFEGAVAKARAEGKTINEEAYKRGQAYYQSDKGQAYFRKKALEGQGSQNPEYQTSKIGLAIQNIGAFGVGISQAGMGIQAFGSILSSSANPALQLFGSALTTIGGLISGLGMGISGLSAGFSTLSGSTFVTTIATELLGATEATLAAKQALVAGALGLLVAALAGAVFWIKKNNEKIKKEAEEVGTKYKEKTDKAQSNITNLQSWREDFARLVGGVDANGNNVSLSSEDYDRYLEIARGIAEINPAIVEGYNAQGQAIITNNKALEETLELEKQHQAEAFTEYTSPDSLEKILRARDLSKQVKTKEGTISQYGAKTTTQISTGEVEFKPQANMRKNAKKIGEMLQKGIEEGWAEKDLLSDFNIDIAKLAEGDEETLSKFDQFGAKIQQRISDKMDYAGDELKDSTKKGMLDAMSGYSEAADELDELIVPTYDYLLATTAQYASKIPAEFKQYFNEGLKGIASDANVTDIDKAAKDFANEFSDLTAEGSEYYELLQDVEKAQDEYARTLDKTKYDEFINGTDGARQRIEALLQSLEKSGMDLNQGYGQAIREFLENELSQIEHFTEGSTVSLKQALNTMIDQITAAEGALENFNSIAEGSTYGKAASNMSQIFETATADEHILGEGDQAFWAGAEALVGRANLLEGGGTNKDKALKQMKEVQEMLKGGQEGWDNFKIKWFDSADAGIFDKISGLKLDENGWIDEIDENINPQVYDEIADKLNMSKESLIAMLNLGRQFGEISFTNVEDVRKALATSENTIKNANNRKLFVRKESLEAEMTAAGVDLNKQQEIESDLQKNYNTEFIEAADKINKSNEQFTDMGITSMESLVKTFEATGEFTKDEIQAYGEAYARVHGEEFNAKEFEDIWSQNQTDQEFGGIPSSLTTIESILSSIESLIAGQDLAEGRLAKSTAEDAKQWLYGQEGTLDTNAQKFWKGQGANGDITTSEFNQTKADLENFINTGSDYLTKLEQARSKAEENGDLVELQKIEQERVAYENMLAWANKFLTEGTEAYNNQLQQKIEGLQKDSDLVNKGFGDLFANLTPEQINTDAAQAALNQLYDAAISNTPAILTDSLMAQMESLGIDIQKAIDAELVIDKDGVQASAKKAGQDTAEAGVEGNASGQAGVDTAPAKQAGEQKGKETGEAGVDGNANGQSSVPTPTSNTSAPPSVTKAETQDSKITVSADVDENTLEKAKTLIVEVQGLAEQGVDFAINVTGTQQLTKASNAAEKLNSSSGEKTINVSAGSLNTNQLSQDIKNISKSEAKIKVGADTKNALAQAENARKVIDNKKATIDVSVNQTGNRTVSIVVKKSGSTVGTASEHLAKGKHNHGYFSAPAFGSVARGRYGQLGPKGKGGLTLTGELGYEVAWLPSENRSMILGANGPQMINLPGDAVVWDHEQSKRILKQDAIPAGSHYVKGKEASDPRKTGGRGGSASRTIVNNAKKAGDKVSKTAEDTKKGIERVLVWWDNAGRRAEAIQRRADANQKTYEKYLKEIQSTLQTTGTIGKGNVYLADMQKLITEQQRQYNKANKELKQLASGKDANGKKVKANKTNYKNGADNVVQISYEAGKGKKKKTKTAYVNTAGYIKYDSASGAYQVDQSELDKVKNESQRKAIADAVKKELDDRVSKRNKAEDEMQKAQEAIEKMGEELYNTFFKWETELTKIWNITQKIEATEARIGRAKGYSELLTSQLSTGLAKAGKDFAENSLNAFKTGIDNRRKQIEQTLESVGEKRNNLSRLLSLDDEKKTLENIQKKLSGDVIADYNIEKAEAAEAKAKAALDKAQNQTKTTITANKKITKISRTLKKGSKGSDVKDLQKALNQALGTNLAIDGKFGSKTQAAVKKFQKKYGLSQTGKMDKKTLAKLANVTGTKKTTKVAGDPEVIAKAQEAYDKAVELTKSIKEGDLNETEKLGYETYAEALEKGINAQAEAWKYLTVQRRGDGTIDLNFNTEAFEEAKQNGEISEELGKSIQDYVKELVDSNKDLNEEYEKVTSLMNDLYGELETLQDQWVGYANDLWDMSEAETKKRNDNAKKLNDSLTKALKDLLDDVKKKLDQRRQQEDNAKTERDISQKQQRLAALRADTSGGHQVEIAQLEKEIAEAQQNYQRTLEDQLLERLQEQADIAEQQRERQIELQETIAEAVNNAALVDMWMADPATFEQEIWEAYKAQNDYDKKPQALQEDLLNKFNVMFDGLLNNQKEQAHVQKQIEELQKEKDILDDIKENVETLATNASTESVSGGEGVEEGGTQELLTQVLNKLIEDDKPKTTSTTPTATNTPAKKTTNKLKYGKVSAVSGTLKKGSSGNGVKALQDALNKILGTKLAIDGKFSSKTFAAVKKFQKKYGLSQDGVVGSKTKAKFKALGYATGGLADYTGPAWLDGTPSKPELVLSATDTKNFLALRDVLSGAMKSADSINSSYGGDATYEININVDHLSSDYDVDKVAERVKKIIVKDSSYRNVTQVRNFR